MTAIKKISVGIVDDHKMVRIGLKKILSDFKNIEVIFDVNDGIALFKKLKHSKPDILLLDLKLPGMNGIEITKIIKSEYPSIKIIIISNYDHSNYISALIKEGVNSYLIKDANPVEIVKTIQEVYNNNYYFKGNIKTTHRKIKNKIEITIDGVQLTKREKQILVYLCKEYTVKEIASKLFISTRTIEGHRAKIKEKTGATTFAGFIKYAYKINLIETEL